MKCKLILGFLLLAGLQVFSQTTKELCLKGKVKSIEQKYERCPMIAVVGTAFECYEENETFYFDKNGERTYLDPQKEITNQYITEKINTKDGYILVKSLEWDGVKRKHFEEYFTNKDVKTKVVMFHADGEITNIWEYIYDKKGNKKEQKVTDFWNGTKTVYHHWFNKYGDIVLSKEFKNDELVNEQTFDITYTFDKKGNWLTKSKEGDYNEMFKRVITYY